MQNVSVFWLNKNELSGDNDALNFYIMKKIVLKNDKCTT